MNHVPPPRARMYRLLARVVQIDGLWNSTHRGIAVGATSNAPRLASRDVRSRGRCGTASVPARSRGMWLTSTASSVRSGNSRRTGGTSSSFCTSGIG